MAHQSVLRVILSESFLWCASGFQPRTIHSAETRGKSGIPKHPSLCSVPQKTVPVLESYGDKRMEAQGLSVSVSSADANSAVEVHEQKSFLCR